MAAEILSDITAFCVKDILTKVPGSNDNWQTTEECCLVQSLLNREIKLTPAAAKRVATQLCVQESEISNLTATCTGLVVDATTLQPLLHTTPWTQNLSKPF